MSDDRLDVLKNAVAEPVAEYAPVRIDRIKLSNYKFFHGDFELTFDGKNVLLYIERIKFVCALNNFATATRYFNPTHTGAHQ